MKVQVKSHSVRFRLGPGELEQLLENGVLRQETHIPVAPGEEVVFVTEVLRGESGVESELKPQLFGFTLLLSPADCDALASAGTEGVYLRREWTNEAGESVRFLAYIEKDKQARKHPASSDEAASGPEVSLQ